VPVTKDVAREFLRAGWKHTTGSHRHVHFQPTTNGAMAGNRNSTLVCTRKLHTNTAGRKFQKPRIVCHNVRHKLKRHHHSARVCSTTRCSRTATSPHASLSPRHDTAKPPIHSACGEAPPRRNRWFTPLAVKRRQGEAGGRHTDAGWWTDAVSRHNRTSSASVRWARCGDWGGDVGDIGDIGSSPRSEDSEPERSHLCLCWASPNPSE
jgi:hypothetical protein